MSFKTETSKSTLNYFPDNKGKKISAWRKLEVLFTDLKDGFHCFLIKKFTKKNDWLTEDQVKKEYYNSLNK